MVKYSEALDATFFALSDPTRRRILERLAQGQRRVTDLARPFDISLPAVSKHLKVLESAGLVRRTRVGREHRIRVDPGPIGEARAWMAMYAEVWQEQFERLDRYLERVQREGGASGDPEEESDG